MGGPPTAARIPGVQRRVTQCLILGSAALTPTVEVGRSAATIARGVSVFACSSCHGSTGSTPPMNPQSPAAIDAASQNFCAQEYLRENKEIKQLHTGVPKRGTDQHDEWILYRYHRPEQVIHHSASRIGEEPRFAIKEIIAVRAMAVARAQEQRQGRRARLLLRNLRPLHEAKPLARKRSGGITVSKKGARSARHGECHRSEHAAHPGARASGWERGNPPKMTPKKR